MIGLRICEVCKGGFLSFYGKTAKIEAGKRGKRDDSGKTKRNLRARDSDLHLQRSWRTVWVETLQLKVKRAKERR